ncbi:MAG: BTAD domain-containing putative transcriptional regulator, partial [Gammaproteobacteria bacterium]|nr:BTAD domain-containing putative transcriptional regulator [Gammaproteobacteria bacterium]
MRDTLELNLLGGFQLLDAQGREIAIRGNKVKALLAYLALAPDGPQARAKLAGLVWGDHSETRARQNLRQGLSTLRRALGERADAILVTDESSIKLAEGAVTTDAVMLERAVEDDDLEATIDLYTGELLDDLGPVFESFDDWLAAARLRLRDLAADSWQALGERRMDSRDPAGAIEVARKLVELEVLREPAHRLLMRAYVAAGRRTEALQQYHILERTLDAELDATPDAESQRLFEEVGAKRSPPAPERAGEKPVIAVLPFTNMSGDPDQEYFADGITDDIITELSRSRMFDVVARNSVFGYKGANVDIRRLGSELNV